MTRKYLALRVRHYNDIVTFLTSQGISIIQSRLETRDQALRNVTEGLYDRGMERSIDQHELRWMLIEGPQDNETINSWPICELCLDVQWFDDYKNSIRHYSGVAYWDATYGLAKELTIKPQKRQLNYNASQVTRKTNNPTCRESVNIQSREQALRESSPATKRAQSKPLRRRKKPAHKESQLDLFA